MPSKYPLREDPSCSMVRWKRINSQKKEFATHNSFDKGLKESIVQPSTPELLLLNRSHSAKYKLNINSCRLQFCKRRIVKE